MRICSFLPSATEMVYLLGLGDSLYGVSHECDFPSEAASKPKVVRSRLNSEDLDSRQIDEAVSQMMARGENIYYVDEDALAAARPDLVITQQLCEVCAVSFEDVSDAVERLDSVPTVLSLDPHGMGDVLEDILRLGRQTGTESVAHHAAFGMRGRIDAIRRALARANSAPSVACIEWLDPIMSAGHWVPEMVEMAGGADALSRPGAMSARIDMERLAAADPDIIILMPCGMDATRAQTEFYALPSAGEWRGLRAFAEGRAYAVDSGALFSRSGPRLVDGIEIMARILHPNLFGELQPEHGARLVDAGAV